MKFKGFSLVEIMIVVAILAMISAIAIPNLLRAKIAANDTNARVVLKTLSTAAEHYSNVTGVYPTDITSLTSTTPPYLNTSPCDVNSYGFVISCSMTPVGYAFTAVPLAVGASGTGSTTFTMVTGGVLSP